MNKEKEANDQELSIIILTPDGNYEGTFPKTAKVQEVINAVIQHFGYAQNGRYELHLSDTDEVLDPNRTLVSYHIKDGDQLVFTDLGTAV